MNTEKSERHDEMLMGILREQKTITAFLDSIFGFLSRRTDFYYESKSEIDKIGFPPGVRKGLVLKMLEKNNPNTTTENKSPYPSLMSEISTVTPPCPSIEIKSSPKPKALFQPNEYYNGAAHDTYCWSQTNSELEIHIHLPDNIKSSKQLDLKINAQSVTVKEKSNPDHIIFHGHLSHKCRHTEAVWSLSGRQLQISLDKSINTWWDRLILSEDSIDTNQIDCEIPIEEYPEETQSELKRIQWDQEQKLRGLPTSVDIMNTERLRRAWDAEGSPFRGQPFDPSVVSFSDTDP